MPLYKLAVISTTSLAVLLGCTTLAHAQGPWSLTIRPNTTPLSTGACTPVQLDLLDAAGREAPRTPAGARVSIADFDMNVSGAGVVGRYDGAAAWSACACPTAAGAVATITATYPAKALPERARVPGVTFQSSIAVPVVAGRSSGVPIGCEAIKTTTTGAAGQTPWTVTLTSSVSALPIGACTPIRIDLRDATGKSDPRNPAGQLLSFADFDMTVAAPGGASVVGQADGATIWSACVCQGSTIGALATITASYPARALADRARVPGVAFQSSITMPLAAPRGTANPPACLVSGGAASGTARSAAAGGAAGGAAASATGAAPAAGGAASSASAGGAGAVGSGAVAGTAGGAAAGGAAGGAASSPASTSTTGAAGGGGAGSASAAGPASAAPGGATSSPASSSGGGAASGGATAAGGPGAGAATATPSAAGAARSPGALLVDTRALLRQVDAEVATSAASVQALTTALNAADQQALQKVCAALMANPNDEQARRQFEQIMARYKNQTPDDVVRFCLNPSYTRLQSEMQSSAQALESRSSVSGDAPLTLQEAMRGQQQALQILSNLSKVLHDTMMRVIQNMK